MTNGLLSILVDGNVVMKIITGSDGQQMENVAEQIRKLNKVPSIEEAYEMACKVFGRDNDSVVVSTYSEDKVHTSIEAASLPEEYRSKFWDPVFNPRLKSGEVHRIAIVNFIEEDTTTEPQTDDTLVEMLKTPIEDLELSVRAFNCLKASKIDTLGQLVVYTKEELMKFRNVSSKILSELESILHERGLSLDMKV